MPKSMTRGFTIEQDTQIRRGNRAGLSTAEIAAELGKSYDSVQSRMKALGISYPVGKRRKKVAA